MQSTMINKMGDAFRTRKVDTYATRVRNAWGVAYISQVQIMCIPPHQLAPAETQPNILVKSLTEAVTGADVLDHLFEDNAEPDPEIPSQFLRTLKTVSGVYVSHRIGRRWPSPLPHDL